MQQSATKDWIPDIDGTGKVYDKGALTHIWMTEAMQILGRGRQI